MLEGFVFYFEESHINILRQYVEAIAGTVAVSLDTPEASAVVSTWPLTVHLEGQEFHSLPIRIIENRLLELMASHRSKFSMHLRAVDDESKGFLDRLEEIAGFRGIVIPKLIIEERKKQRGDAF